MDDIIVKILFTLLALYVGVLTWGAKTLWQTVRENAREIEKLKLTCATCKKESHEDTEKEIQKLLEQISKMIEEKLDAWWVKIELNLVNDSRLPPKRRTTNKGE